MMSIMSTKAPAKTPAVVTLPKALVDLEADQAALIAALQTRARLKALRQEWVTFRGELYPLKLHENMIDLAEAALGDLAYLDHCISLIGDDVSPNTGRYRFAFREALRVACNDPSFDPMPILQHIRAVINQRPTLASVS